MKTRITLGITLLGLAFFFGKKAQDPPPAGQNASQRSIQSEKPTAGAEFKKKSQTAENRPVNHDGWILKATDAVTMTNWAPGSFHNLPIQTTNNETPRNQLRAEIQGVVQTTGTAADGQQFISLQLDPDETGYGGDAFLLMDPGSGQLSGYIHYDHHKKTYKVVPTPDGNSRLEKTTEDEFICFQNKEGNNPAYEGMPLPEIEQAAAGTTEATIIPMIGSELQEPSEGKSRNYDLTFRLSKPTDKKTVIHYKTIGISAQKNKDYAHLDKKITLKKGASGFTITVSIVGDGEDEAAEPFGIITSTSDNSYKTSKAIVTIAATQPVQNAATVTSNIGPQGAVPILESKPAARKLIYLDFNGATISGTSWNSKTGQAVIINPSVETKIGTSQIQTIWQRISATLSNYDVNVSTNVDTFLKTADSDKMWVAFTTSPSLFNASGLAGLAFIDAFGKPNYQPAVVTCDWTTNGDNIATAAAHEVGHGLSLKHDGTKSQDYYAGHGTGTWSWGTIMGTSYYKSVQQWSKGDYTGSNNTEDDLSKIAKYLTTYTDEKNSSITAATILTLNTTTPGRINSGADTDYFKYTGTAGAHVTIQMNKPNPKELALVPTFKILSTSGAVLVTPTQGSWSQTPGQCFWTGYLPAATIIIQSTSYSFGTPLATSPSGATSYGCIGDYQITVKP